MFNDILTDVMEDSQFVDIMNNDIMEEGEQADAYRARKEKEKKEAEAKEKEREERRYNDAGYVKRDENFAKAMDKKERDYSEHERMIDKHFDNKAGDAKAGKRVNKEMFRRVRTNIHDIERLADGSHYAVDAAAKHERRHGTKESYLGINIE